MTRKNRVGEISGRVSRQNWLHFEAPSVDAASYSSRGTFCNAASRITIEPATPHSPMITIDGFTQAGSTSHCGAWILNSPRNQLIAPVLLLSSSRNTEAVATAGVIF